MDADFWIKAWIEGRTNFHQSHYNDQLLAWFPKLNPAAGQRVLIPLCGKTKDLVWLHDLKLDVHGVELHEDAVKSFFTENELSPVETSRDQNFHHYTYKKINISCGDFFKLPENEKYDFIYDRAALVALPEVMRKNYAEVIKRSLKKGGKCLLIVYEYDQAKMDGPPFSVDEKEIHALYQDVFSIQLMDSKSPEMQGPKFSALGKSLREKVYCLEKVK